MVMWTFWAIFIMATVIAFQTTFIFANWSAIKFNFALFFGNKTLCLWKQNNRIIDWKLIKKEPELGIERDKKTYDADDKKGLYFRRMAVHLFDDNNIAELDFTDRSMYPPFKFDPSVHYKTIRRALASGVNDVNWMQILMIAGIVGVIVAIGLIVGVYFDYQTYEWLRDYLVNQKGVIKL